MLDTQIPDKRIYKETSNPPATNLPFGWPSTIVPSDVQHLEVAPSQLQRGFRIQRAWNSEWVVVPGNTGNWCLFVWMLLDFSVVNWKNPSRAIGRIRSAPPKIFRPISHVKQRCGGCKNAYGSDCTTPLQSFGPTTFIYFHCICCTEEQSPILLFLHQWWLLYLSTLIILYIKILYIYLS